MRRPLLAVCMCFVAGMAVWLMLGRTFPGRGRFLTAEWDDVQITVTGNVYRKDSRYFYLDSVIIQNYAANQQQNISLTENLICEYNENPPKIGSNVTVQGLFALFDSATNPGEFDAAKYYKTLGLSGKIREAVVVEASEEYSLCKETLFQVREYFEQRLYSIFPEKEASVMTAMLLGDKQGLDSEIRDLYQDNGIIHILSISGLHISIIGMSIYKLLRRMGVPVWVAAALGGIVLLLYGVMTGMSVSACRAIGMYLIRMLGEVVGRTYDMLTATGVMAALMVADNPLNLQNAGFLLSFGAIAGIGIVYPVMLQGMCSAAEQKKLRGRRTTAHTRYEPDKRKCILKEIAAKIQNKLIQSMISGLSITLATLPIQLWFYYEVPTYSVLLNILVLPFMTWLMLTGLVAMLVPGLGIVGTVDYLILTGYEWLCKCFEQLPCSTWNPGKPDVWQIVVYYAVMLLIVVEVRSGIVQRVKDGIQRKLLKRKGQEIKKILRPGYARIIALTLIVSIFAVKFPVKTCITFLDVGQGDCICIQLASGEVYLFDCGSTGRGKVGEYVLKPYLKYCGVSYVDAIFVSHMDADHCSGVIELLQNGEDWGITVGQLVLAENSNPLELLQAAELHGISEEEILFIEAGDYWRNGNSNFYCLHPPSNFTAEDTNAGSQCFYIQLEQGVDVLLTGDVEGEGEELLLKELQKRNISDITLLKVAHHGSKYASGEAFLNQVSPGVAVISCGENNSYGHPHTETLERLEEVGCKVLTTPECGAITVEIGKEIKIWGEG